LLHHDEEGGVLNVRDIGFDDEDYYNDENRNNEDPHDPNSNGGSDRDVKNSANSQGNSENKQGRQETRTTGNASCASHELTKALNTVKNQSYRNTQTPEDLEAQRILRTAKTQEIVSNSTVDFVFFNGQVRVRFSNGNIGSYERRANKSEKSAFWRAHDLYRRENPDVTPLSLSSQFILPMDETDAHFSRTLSGVLDEDRWNLLHNGGNTGRTHQDGGTGTEDVDTIQDNYMCPHSAKVADPQVAEGGNNANKHDSVPDPNMQDSKGELVSTYANATNQARGRAMSPKQDFQSPEPVTSPTSLSASTTQGQGPHTQVSFADDGPFQTVGSAKKRGKRKNRGQRGSRSPANGKQSPASLQSDSAESSSNSYSMLSASDEQDFQEGEMN